MKKIILILLAINLYGSSFFVSLGDSIGKTSVNDSVDNQIVLNPIDDNIKGLHLQLGYDYSKRVSFIYNIKKLQNGTGEFFNNFISVDYQLTSREPFYIGASFGVGDFKWKESPYNKATKSDMDVSSSLYGVHLGYLFELVSSLNLYTQVSYQKSDFISKIITPNSSGEINYDRLIDIVIGIRKVF